MSTLPGAEGWGGVRPKSDLVERMSNAIEARRTSGAIQPWHEGICAAVLELAEEAQHAKGIAKAQLYAQMLAAEARLPDPVVEEKGEVLEYEADRIRAYLEEFDRARDAATAADDQDAEIPAPV